jgi:hypothetical protein
MKIFTSILCVVSALLFTNAAQAMEDNSGVCVGGCDVSACNNACDVELCKLLSVCADACLRVVSETNGCCAKKCAECAKVCCFTRDMMCCGSELAVDSMNICIKSCEGCADMCEACTECKTSLECAVACDAVAEACSRKCVGM